MNDPVRLEALETLDAIERHGSFAAAAAALYRVPSAVSYTVSQLESDLGIAVFDRSGHRAVLTPAGRLLLDEGRRILTASRELGAAAQRLADHWEPELRLAVDGLIAPQQLWPAIGALQRAHPAINLRVCGEVLGGTWEALIEDRVDLAIGVAEPPAGAGIRRAPFTQVTFLFCCAPDHPLAAIEHPLTEDELRAWRAVVVADSARHLSARSAGLLDGQPRLTVTTMHSKIEAIEQGLGIGHCPAAWVQTALAAGRLVERPLATPRDSQRTHLLWRTAAPGRALQWFLERLESTAT
ncbi:LysR family transcriptional regulator [Endozoicomonas sp. G2_2]|uniref:LysR substrate-binding domain-containing protein n=1 Tax=Endozoicomonas sp. G2_2 TaxID=2821092 RepID=UPI001ADC1FD3|nr:LysR substrate-binding domain-containing protein [Endozoicomonas sp. G2_2]MBO9469282.1 LysR family transcriptional regulator [Endozoicomonas sp. G2_2]